jgi:uncharacterized protein (TIGR00369 family)
MAADVHVDQELTAQVRGLMPLAGLLGVEILHANADADADADGDQVRARLSWRRELCTAGGVMHGGALMALADSIGAMLAFSRLPEGALGTATLSSTTNFLAPVRDGAVEATARVLHQGRTTIVVETDLVDGTGRLVARVTQTQVVLAGG